MLSNFSSILLFFSWTASTCGSISSLQAFSLLVVLLPVERFAIWDIAAHAAGSSVPI